MQGLEFKPRPPQKKKKTTWTKRKNRYICKDLKIIFTRKNQKSKPLNIVGTICIFITPDIKCSLFSNRRWHPIWDSKISFTQILLHTNFIHQNKGKESHSHHHLTLPGLRD